MLIKEMPEHMQARALAMYNVFHNSKGKVIGKKEFPFNLSEGKFKTVAIDDALNAVKLENIVLLKSDLDDIQQLMDVLDFKYDGHKIIFVEKWEGDCINEKLGDFTKDLPALVSTSSKYLLIEDVTLVFGYVSYDLIADVIYELSCKGLQELEAEFVSNVGNHLVSDYNDKLRRIKKDLTEVDRQRHQLSNSYASINTVLKIFNLNKEGYFKQIVEDIRALPNVESVRFYSANGILITTTELSTDNLLSNGRNFKAKYVGAYEIRFNFKHGSIHARNIAAPSNRFQILYQGLSNSEDDVGTYTCMGSFSSLLSDALQNCDYAKTINYTIEYLRSFDPDDSNAEDAYKSLKTERPEKLHRFSEWVKIAGG